MAAKKCPSCGKKVSSEASYCIFCSARFDEIDTVPLKKVSSPRKEAPASNKKSGLKWILIIGPAILVLGILVFLSLSFWPSAQNESSDVQTKTTHTTRDPQRDDWLHTYEGRWVDESSVGKKSIAEQGGSMLFIHTIKRDLVEFDLMSYSGGEISKIAAVSAVKAIMLDDTLHFTFPNDTQGHSGEGYLRFRDGEIDLEILIEDHHTDEGDHSLAMNTVFKRSDLPEASGVDLRTLTSLEAIKQVAGEQTSAPVVDEKTKQTTYKYGALSAVVDNNGVLLSVTADYRSLQDKTTYCFECVDGTMGYQTVKEYFGEALHDYVEQPTNIRVLYYEFKNKTETQFTFDAENNLLIKIVYHQAFPTTTTSPSVTATTTVASTD